MFQHPPRPVAVGCCLDTGPSWPRGTILIYPRAQNSTLWGLSLFPAYFQRPQSSWAWWHWHLSWLVVCGEGQVNRPWGGGNSSTRYKRSVSFSPRLRGRKPAFPGAVLGRAFCVLVFAPGHICGPDSLLQVRCVCEEENNTQPQPPGTLIFPALLCFTVLPFLCLNPLFPCSESL